MRVGNISLVPSAGDVRFGRTAYMPTQWSPRCQARASGGSMLRVKDMLGKRYGKLVVVERAGTSSGHRALWLCQCDCGGTKITSGRSLRRGAVKSCGCLKRSNRIQTLIDEEGNRYGRLMVVARVAPPRKGLRSACWLCRCDCGGEKVVAGTQLRRGRTRSCGCLRREGIREPGEASFSVLWEAMHRRAKSGGLEWRLSQEQVRSLTGQACVYCGLEPSMVSGAGLGLNGYYIYNGLDRVDSSLGYIPENVVSCCKDCNLAKRANSRDYFEAWLDRVARYRGGTDG